MGQQERHVIFGDGQREPHLFVFGNIAKNKYFRQNNKKDQAKKVRKRN
jgi:hypothetical protein